jgi:6-phosphogluconolactonase/glucosamine-6-phosphate isomerase/deaminase
VVVSRTDADAAIDSALADVFMQANGCIGAFGSFHFAVCASRSAEPALRRLMFDPALRSFPWRRTRLWLTDELAVPEEDDRRRGRALHDLIVTQSDLPESQFHEIPGWREDAEAAYERVLQEHLGWREKGHDRLDAVLLVVEESGAVAGLSRGSAALGRREGLVVRDERAPGPDAVTMGLRLLNASRMICVVAVGPSMQPLLRAVEASRGAPGVLPLSHLSPVGGELRWYVDEESRMESGTGGG